MWGNDFFRQGLARRICNRRKNGELYWVSATIVPFLDSIGLPIRYIGIRTDITARKAMEAELESSCGWSRI